MDTTFSLKDQLFNLEKVTKIANEIQSVYPDFAKADLVATCIGKFPELELKQRITWIAQSLRAYLPNDFQEATTILLRSLPPINDPTKTDNDFGDFIYAPYAEFVAKYGCSTENLQFSLVALKEITQRFSVEDAIRYFINAFPDETMAALLQWSTNPHYHVRRLASEGTRPKLPWSQKIAIPVQRPLPILNNLFFDTTRYVTRSVANHLNDISKTDPELVLQTLGNWQRSGKQTQKEMAYIISHSLRTLLKQGYPPAFTFLNFSNKAAVIFSNFKTEQTQVKIGDPLEFSFSLRALEDENILIDYVLSFQNKRQEMNSKKVFKLKKIAVQKGQTVILKKTHPLRERMTTRTIYPGEHKLEIQINGVVVGAASFEVVQTK